MSAYSKELRCAWIAWRVETTGELALDLPAGNCPDMTAAIDLARKLMPSVAWVRTYVDGSPDTIYFRGAKGWVALEP